MEQRDYLMREIERMSQILAKLIGKVIGLNPVNYEVEIKKINNVLSSEFGFELEELEGIDSSKFTEIIKNIDKSNIELLLKLLSEIIDKIIELEKDNKYNINDLCKKAILIIDQIDNKTKTFSMERMKVKTRLKGLIKVEN